MNPLTLLTTNLTPYHNVELWITRSCLLISISIIGPTVVLFILDLLLWCFRAGQGPSSDFIRRSKSGIDLLQQKARRRSSSNSSSTSSTAFTDLVGQDKSNGQNRGIAPLTRQPQTIELSSAETTEGKLHHKSSHVTRKDQDELRQLEEIKLNRERTDPGKSFDNSSNLSEPQTQPVVKMVGMADRESNNLTSPRSNPVNIQDTGVSTSTDARIQHDITKLSSHSSPTAATLADYRLGKVLE